MCSLPVYSKVRKSVRAKIDAKPHEAALERIRTAKSLARVHQLAQQRLKEYDDLKAQLVQCEFDPDRAIFSPSQKFRPPV